MNSFEKPRLHRQSISLARNCGPDKLRARARTHAHRHTPKPRALKEPRVTMRRMLRVTFLQLLLSWRLVNKWFSSARLCTQRCRLVFFFLPSFPFSFFLFFLPCRIILQTRSTVRRVVIKSHRVRMSARFSYLVEF